MKNVDQIVEQHLHESKRLSKKTFLLLIGILVLIGIWFSYKMFNLPFEEEKLGIMEVQRTIDAENGQSRKGVGAITRGYKKGEEVTITEDLFFNPGYHLEPGQKILVQEVDFSGEPQFVFVSFYRSPALFWLMIFFVIFLVLFLNKQSVQVLFSLIIDLILIAFVFVPLLLQGYSPIALAIPFAILLTIVTLIVSSGWNKKSLSAILGTLGGILLSLIISIIFSEWAKVGGFSTEEGRLFFLDNPDINANGIFYAGILIGAVGIIEDVAISISAAIEEIKQAAPQTAWKKLYSAGVRIGRDHFGAVANTLIFAYVGSSLAFLLFFYKQGLHIGTFFNIDFVAEEIIRSIGGTIGLTATIPITAFIAAKYFAKE